MSSASSSQSSKESAEVITTNPKYTIAKIDNCGVGISPPAKTYSLIADYGFNSSGQNFPNVGGWNHVANGDPKEWKNIKLNPTEYAINSKGVANPSCNNVDALNVILVKKYANWDHQHSNGLQKFLAADGQMFGDITAIVVDLKINSAKTSLATFQNLKNTYGAYGVSDNTIRSMDGGMVNIGLTFSDNSTLKASIIIELDQNMLFDEWVRVTIDMNKMDFYSENNYVRTPKPRTELDQALITTMNFMGETRTGSVLRGAINNWNDTVPETFKEMDLSIKKIEFTLK